MPNPYHDDQGRFCSKGEMRASIGRLLEKGEIGVAMKMQQELSHYELVNAKEADETRVSQLKSNILNTSPQATPVLSVITAQNASNADINQAQKELKLGLAEAKKETADIDVERAELNIKLSKEYGEDITVDRIYNKRFKLEQQNQEAKQEVRDFIRNKAITAGIPSRYIDGYLERKAPELGFNDYVNTYQGTISRAHTPYDISAESPVWNSTTRPAEYKEIIKGIAKEAEVEGKFAQYNNTYPQAEQIGHLYNKYNTQYLDLTRRARIAEEKTKKFENALANIETVKQWRKNLTDNGVSKYARVSSARGVAPSEIKKTANGEIANVYAFNINGTGERIVGVKESSYSSTSGLLIGESGREYYSQVHWANRGRSYPHDDYLVVDPTVKGTAYFDKDSPIKSFYSEYDSGD